MACPCLYPGNQTIRRAESLHFEGSYLDFFEGLARSINSSIARRISQLAGRSISSPISANRLSCSSLMRMAFMCLSGFFAISTKYHSQITMYILRRLFAISSFNVRIGRMSTYDESRINPQHSISGSHSKGLTVSSDVHFSLKVDIGAVDTVVVM